MTETEAYQLVLAAITKVAPSKTQKVTEDSDLLSGGILDSLDVMNFLFEVEQRLGRKLTAIDETYNDFRVKSLLNIICASQP
jgi:acyl carrier protein